ncbi:hypothetical protein CANARDRAFT_26740 [[Candida] arabinofermentans NRRL YB-2248]|uniref:Uncharacterized protein n=1 Tax=[Candida] arabinofermentans NRRL YB-2248 TaxID=983967 RepID=A0A1E4T6F1_9ASCO|nr:hypothetical protein CANARDRAFT_26740 [[Candida] arabinofermentans NRRL YB-2248]
MFLRIALDFYLSLAGTSYDPLFTIYDPLSSTSQIYYLDIVDISMYETILHSGAVQ